MGARGGASGVFVPRYENPRAASEEYRESGHPRDHRLPASGKLVVLTIAQPGHGARGPPGGSPGESPSRHRRYSPSVAITRVRGPGIPRGFSGCPEKPRSPPSHPFPDECATSQMRQLRLARWLLRMYLLDMDSLTRQPAPLAPATLGRADQHPVAVYLARLSPGSRRAMTQALGVVAGILSAGKATRETLPWASLRYQHTQAARAALVERYAPATANKALAALRGVLREAFRLGQMSAEDYTRASDVAGVKGQNAPRGRALKTGELVALFGACDATTAQGARDAALLAVLYGAGLRRAEAVALDLADFESESGELRIRSGKGRKPRTVYVTNGAREAVTAWLEVRGSEAGPLFLAVDKAGNVRSGRVTPGAVYQILDRLQAAARVKPFSPHDCRRSYVTALLAAGNSIAVVQKLAGHASVSTTARYDRSDEDAKRKAAETLHVPFAG